MSSELHTDYYDIRVEQKCPFCGDDMTRFVHAKKGEDPCIACACGDRMEDQIKEPVYEDVGFDAGAYLSELFGIEQDGPIIMTKFDEKLNTMVEVKTSYSDVPRKG